MNGDFQAILKLSHNSNALILDKVGHVAIATNCHFKFYQLSSGIAFWLMRGNLFSWQHFETSSDLLLMRLTGDIKIWYFPVKHNVHLLDPF